MNSHPNHSRKTPVMLLGLLALLSLAFGIWGYLKRQKSIEDLEALQQRLRFSQSGTIPARAGTLAALRDSIAELRTLNQDFDQKLYSGRTSAIKAFAGNSTAAYFELASFVETSIRRLRNAGIEVGEGERLGYLQFEQEGPDATLLQDVMAQKACTEVLLNILVKSKPVSLVHIHREHLVAADAAEPSVLQQAAGSGSRQRNHPADTIEAQTEDGPLNGFAFALSFEGYTDSLRRFLKGSLAAPVPVLVKHVSVEPLDRYEPESESTAPPASGNPFDAIADPNTADDGPVPIIRNNLSRFNLRLEVYTGKETPADS